MRSCPASNGGFRVRLARGHVTRLVRQPKSGGAGMDLVHDGVVVPDDGGADRGIEGGSRERTPQCAPAPVPSAMAMTYWLATVTVATSLWLPAEAVP